MAIESMRHLGPAQAAEAAGAAVRAVPGRKTMVELDHSTPRWALGKGEVMTRQKTSVSLAGTRPLAVAVAAAFVWFAGAGQPARAWSSEDGTAEIHGFVDSTTHQRFGRHAGLSKQRFRGQVEFSKFFGERGIFSELSVHGILRATYDAAYDFNDDDWGSDAGGSVLLQSQGGPAVSGLLPGEVPWGFGIPLPGNFTAAGAPSSSANAGTTLLGAVPGGLMPGVSPNDGLFVLGEESFSSSGGTPGFGGVQLAYPSRPCDDDPRGCIDGYMDADEDDLRFPEFDDDFRVLRELYLDATVPLGGFKELNFRIGRQQVVWGRTDLFRVLDQINPIDFSIQNIYEEFEDSRIPLGIFSAELRMGATGIFDDINFQFIWNFEDFQPHILGQGGQPYSILDAGNLFRALATCWQVGCTVANFAPNATPALTAPPGPPTFGAGLPVGFLPLGLAGNAFSTGLLAVDFPANTIGIRQANIPDGNDQFGIRLEGVFKSVGFSLNALYFYQQLPSLHGGTTGPAAINPFIPEGLVDPFTGEVGGTRLPRPYLLAFDIEFPRVLLLGASADFYVEELAGIPVKSAFRVEFAHTNGEEFANTLDPRLYSESNVIRWVVGWDRPTFIRWLNPNRAFLISAQMFGQHLLDHELEKISLALPSGQVVAAEAGMPDWKDNFFFTLLFQGNYMNDRLNPRVISAYDVKAQAGVVAPQIEWIYSDNWRFTLGANLKFGRSKNEFDDCRLCNQFPPFTDPTGGLGPGGAPLGLPVGQTVARVEGISPLGAFRSGPIGMAQDEDEIQLLIRYRF